MLIILPGQRLSSGGVIRWVPKTATVSTPQVSGKCSVGAVWGRPGTATSPADLFALTDELMYKAKDGGKDRCCFKSLEEDEVTVLTSSGEMTETGNLGLPDDSRAVTSEDLQKLAEELN